MGHVANVLGVPISDLYNQNNGKDENNVIKSYSDEQIEQIKERRAKQNLFRLVLVGYAFFMLYIGSLLEYVKNEKSIVALSLLWTLLFICGWILLIYISQSYWRKKLDKMYPLTKNIVIYKKPNKTTENKYVEIVSQVCWRIIVPILFILKFVLHVI